MTQRNGFPSRIDEVLERTFKKLGISKKMKEQRTLKLWKEVVGERISQHTHPFRIRKGVLFVKVDSSAWLAQLGYLKEDIIYKLNRKGGTGVIKDIYFRLGAYSSIGHRRQ